MTNFKQALESAREHFQARRMLDAEAVLDPLVQSAPGYGEVFNLSGLTAYETGKYEKAEIFYEQTRYVGTASQLQVREPIHSKAVNRWKNYEKHPGI